MERFNKARSVPGEMPRRVLHRFYRTAMKKPTTGMTFCCCARGTSGNTAAPPRAPKIPAAASAPGLKTQHRIGSNEYFDRG